MSSALPGLSDGGWQVAETFVVFIVRSLSILAGWEGWLLGAAFSLCVSVEG